MSVRTKRTVQGRVWFSTSVVGRSLAVTPSLRPPGSSVHGAVEDTEVGSGGEDQSGNGRGGCRCTEGTFVRLLGGSFLRPPFPPWKKVLFP